MQDLQNFYNVSLAQILFVGSIAVGERLTLGPIVALIVNKYGYKLSTVLGAIVCASAMIGCLLSQDFLSFKILHGFVMGIGAALLYIPANTCTSFYFDKKQALAFGIVAAGASIGFMVFPLAFRFVYQNFHKEGVFLFNFAASISLIPLILIFYPSAHEVKDRTEYFVKAMDTRRLSAISLAKSSSVDAGIKEQLTTLFEIKVMAYLLAVMFQGAAHTILSLLIPKISDEVLDVPKYMSSLLLTLLGAAGIPSRILVGWFADKSWINPLLLFLLGTAGSGVCCVVYPLVHVYWLMALMVGIQAVIWALYCSTFVVCPLALVGLKKFNFVSGVAYGINGVGAIVAPPAIGYLYESLLGHSIFGVMCVTGTIYGAATIFTLISLLSHRSTSISTNIF